MNAKRHRHIFRQRRGRGILPEAGPGPAEPAVLQAATAAITYPCAAAVLLVAAETTYADVAVDGCEC